MRLFKRIIGILLIYLVFCVSISLIGWGFAPHLSFITFLQVTSIGLLIAAALVGLFFLGINLLEDE